MTVSDWAKKIATGERERLGVAAVVVAVAAVGGFVAVGAMGGGKKTKPEVSANTLTVPAQTFAPAALPEASASPPPEAAPKKTAIVVYVTGAVKRPGVYTLPADARLYHAVRAAGGFKANAVTDALNLADRAQDGDQLAIPARQKAGTKPPATVATAPQTVAQNVSFAPSGVIRKSTPPVTVALPATASSDDAPEVTVLPTPAPPSRVLGTPSTAPVAAPIALEAAPNAPVAVAATTGKRSAGAKPKATAKASDKFKNPGDGIVHLNSATDADLQKLPRCGPAMSAKIQAYRAQIGKFTDLKQLMDVKGVGEKTFEKWQPFLAL